MRAGSVPLLGAALQHRLGDTNCPRHAAMYRRPGRVLLASSYNHADVVSMLIAAKHDNHNTLLLAPSCCYCLLCTMCRLLKPGGCMW